MAKILVTGGCGFIGKALCMQLARNGYKVRVLDSLTEQIHGSNPDLGWTQDYGIDLIRGSVVIRQDCKISLKDVDSVVHLAAETGTGQSMYELTRYMETNVLGTAMLLEECRMRRVKRFVLASSRAVYGEGAWECLQCGRVYPQTRNVNGTGVPESWNPKCPQCGRHTSRLLPTKEDDPLAPTSIYGMSKQAQEQLLLMTAPAIGLGYGILRFFNVFGPGQSLKNPYTGVLSVFINRARLHKTLDLYEDGEVLRDFIYVDEVTRAIQLALDSSDSAIYNIGSAATLSIRRLAELIIRATDSSSVTKVTGKMRLGDVRGLVADNSRAARALPWQPLVDYENDIKRFVQWALQFDCEDRYEQSLKELEKHKLYQ
jgi:dTDP-L-rhamnose 4-epimerase